MSDTLLKVNTSLSAKVLLKTKPGNYLVELVIFFFFVRNKITGAKNTN